MVQYNFKRITVVPSAKDFVDIVLSRTQRQTPTVIHKGNAIVRVRQFYMRKVKFTQQTYNDKLTRIIEDFPRLDDIHPFYGDLLNVLYDKDHYKLALGQMNTARNLIDKICKDYVRLLKYGDSLYRCKQLKKAALGRMCTLMRKQGPSLAYLEQVRQHMSRLPSIDPNTRTILVCGYPNVGKSSFINKVTRADVEVQPYAFTTRSLYVGHTDYKYLRWQVIDTPGILDHPLEDRNTIEMLSITALAHLRASVLFVVDLSGTCGYSIAQQAALFHSIKPLFSNKPLIIACNKTDLQPIATLPEEEKKLLEEMGKEASKCGSLITMDGGSDENDCLLTMSTMMDDGVIAVKNAACEKLLQQRVEVKMKSKKMSDLANRIHVAMPQARDAVQRPPVIPQAVLDRMTSDAPSETKPERDLEKDLQEKFGGAGVYSANLHKHYLLEDDDWKDDIMPEIMDGHNIADFIDPDILQRLEDLEREEEEREATEAQEGGEDMEEDELDPEERETLEAIRYKKKKLREEHVRKRSVGSSRPIIPRTVDPGRTLTTRRMDQQLSVLGLDPSAAIERARSRSRSRGRKRDRSVNPEGDMQVEEGAADAMDVDETRASKRLRTRSKSASGSKEVVALPGDGFKDTQAKKKAIQKGQAATKKRNKEARKGEADRAIYNVRPRHLFSGKRGMGKTDRR